MKNRLILLLLALFPVALFASDAASTGNVTADNIVSWLTPILVPLVLAGLKKISPSIPSWVIPIAAPVLGVLIDLANSYATGHSSNLLVAAGLGLAGVGLREIKDQIKPAANGGWSPTP